MPSQLNHQRLCLALSQRQHAVHRSADLALDSWPVRQPSAFARGPHSPAAVKGKRRVTGQRYLQSRAGQGDAQLHSREILARGDLLKSQAAEHAVTRGEGALWLSFYSFSKSAYRAPTDKPEGKCATFGRESQGSLVLAGQSNFSVRQWRRSLGPGSAP